MTHFENILNDENQVVQLTTNCASRRLCDIYIVSFLNTVRLLSKIVIVLSHTVTKSITQARYFLISEEISIYEKSENCGILYYILT